MFAIIFAVLIIMAFVLICNLLCMDIKLPSLPKIPQPIKTAFNLVVLSAMIAMTIFIIATYLP